MESNKIYVAIGKEVEERESILKWVLNKFPENNICVIYVHVPAKRIPFPSGMELPVSVVSKNDIEAFREKEIENVLQLLNDCTLLCALFQVSCENTFVENDSVPDGILELIHQLRIEKLVMGAAANKYWSARGMTKLMSERAKYVLRFAPDFCHIWFTCNDHLIYKRHGVTKQSPSVEEMPSSACAKAVERQNCEELRLKEETVNMKKMFAKVSIELAEALDQKLSLETELEEFNLRVRELEEELSSEIESSQKHQNERDNLQKQLDQGSTGSIDPMFSEFSFSELQIATNYFDASLKIGEGSYGSMYKGFLHHTQVAIKLLSPNFVQNDQVFNKQVSCISKLRHPNLVTLIGACREPWCLVYEYLSGGTLKDRFIHQNGDTPSLPWHIRIQVAMDICSALIFLHSSKPTCIAQGDLTPVKLLLDANFTCKITDFGVVSKGTVTRLRKPESYNHTLAKNIELDVHSFGIIVLQLLTGRQTTFRIVKEVEYALQMDVFDGVLDPFAGDWPLVQAEQLAHVALRCCDRDGNNYPDLASDVWRVLAPMRASCSSLSLLSVASRDQPPHYFICPILQEIMEDPHFAADGFTYEAEAIRGWLDSDHDKSPMTNVKLANLNLTPNRALRSVIQEWLQMSSSK